MFHRLSKFLDFDWGVIAAIVFLLAFGLIAIYSLSLEGEASQVSNFQKQLFFLGIGSILFFIFSFIDYRVWKGYSSIFYLLSFFLLVAVLFLGKNIRGTSGWFSFGFFNFQPVELVKVFLIIVLAKYFSKFNSGTLGPKQIFVSLLYVLVLVFLAARQPDMGSAMVMLVIWAGMLFLSGAKRKYIFILAISAVTIVLFGWGFLLKDYQKQRINSFLDPGADPLGSGYNVIQSTVAVGSGGWGGKGLGHGSQSRLNFLPEKHTDFIFATIAEETGFVGATLVLGLFGFLLFRLKKTADKARDSFGSLIVGGIMIMIFFQILVNVGMNLGIMPVAGLSLPLLSYGGSFLLITLMSLGISQSVWKRRRKRAVVGEE